MVRIALVLVCSVFLAGCTEGSNPKKTSVIEETGVIEEGDLTDENYGGYRYDSFEFQVNSMDLVTVEIEPRGFQPVLTLHEVSTGAHLAEFDPAYTEDPALVYRIAGGGACEARVYALEDGTGTYTVKITVEGNLSR